MKKKNIIITVVSILIPICIFVSIFILPWMAIFVGTWLFTPTPAKPEITYGEFPFELVYEVDGEIITVNDVYICKYDGIGANEGTGKYRMWEGYIESSEEEAVILVEDHDRKIYCFVGDAEYYMNDERYPEQTPLTPRVYDVDKIQDATIDFHTTNEILEYYNIKIVSWKFSEPIKNSFK